MTDPMYYVPDPISESFLATPSTAEEIEKGNRALKINFLIQMQCLYYYMKISQVILPILADIFNSIRTSESFPSLPKMVKITLI